jgi:RHS repeat-associated protein
MKMNQSNFFLRRRLCIWMALISLTMIVGEKAAWAENADEMHLTLSSHPDPSLTGETDPDLDVGKYQIVVITAPDTPAAYHSVMLYQTYPTTAGPFNECDFNVTVGGTVTNAVGDVSSAILDSKLQTIAYATLVGTFTIDADTGFNTFNLFNHDEFESFSQIIDLYSIRLDMNTLTGTWADSSTEIVGTNLCYNNWTYINTGPFGDIMGAYLSPTRSPITRGQRVFFLLPGPLEQAWWQPFIPQKCKCKGMASASFDSFQAGIAITDTPISYSPGIGPAMDFTVTYHQRLNNEATTFNYSNLGPQWRGSWISYISDGPTNGETSAVHHMSDGNIFNYGGYEPSVVQGLGLTPVNEGDFTTNQGWTHATLHYRQSPERYERWLPDGTVEAYAQAVGTSPNRLFFLTSITDPQGNVTRLAYDPNAAASGNAVLTTVTDPTGSQLIFTYSASDPLKIAKVTRSKDGLSARFQYASGLLTGSTDTSGMTSTFHYMSGTYFIDSMTTPYGTTTFNSTDGSGYLEADMTNPLGQNERVEYQESLSGSLVAASESAAPSVTGSYTFDNTNLNHANTFYWTRRAIADATAASITVDSAAFYAKAEVTHWAQGNEGSVAIPLSKKMPLEGRVWFNYPGQAGDIVDVKASGVSTSPAVTARVLDDSSTQASYATYNANGLITQSVDPVGRTTNYNYDTNGIDLLTVKQVNGSGQDTLSTMTYNSAHLPLTVTDASGQTTTMTYNSQGQLLTRTDPQSHTTTLAYDSNGDGYLHTVTGPVTGATTTYTYDSAGRVHTVTDSEGYVLTYAYDNLDRPISVTYPDSTTDLTAYKALDVVKTTDRQGRSTYMKYDAIRELLQTTDPLGRTTKYSWCTCGGLSTLTDANNNVTTWGLDLQGRVTSKTYADSSGITYAYETNTSRLHTMTDARGSVATYAYNADNTLAGTSYSVGSGVAATPNVSFGYDSVYNRVTWMADGTGTTTYSYATITGSVTTGAGRLSSVVVPIASSTGTITYAYDELGRVTARDVDHTLTGDNDTSTTFDSLGRVTGVTNALGAFTYAYVDTTSRLSSVTYPSGTGLSTLYSYFGNTGDQRLETIQNLHSSTQLSKFDYTYNAVGTIASWTQQADSSTAVVNTLSYDNADQLTKNVQSGGATAGNGYNYDPAGNRLAETTLSGTSVTATTASLFNNLNQLLSLSGTTSTTTVSGTTSLAASSVIVNGLAATVTGTAYSASIPTITGTNVLNITAKPTSGAPATQRFAATVTGSATTSLAYDANGNTTTDENGNTYSWDALNRLTSIVYNSGPYSGTHTEFAYDGLSRRTQIVERAGTTIGSGTVNSTKNYLWIGSEIAEERDASNTVTKRFFPQGEQQSGTNYYYARDHLGSVREMLNSSGTIVARYAYDAYGNTTVVSGSNLATFQYATLYAHQPSGLELPTFRGGYDPTLGRWIQRDYKGERGGLNLYGYVGDDPINSIDPLGFGSWKFDTSAVGDRSNLDAYYELDADELKCCSNARVDQYSLDVAPRQPPQFDGSGPQMNAGRGNNNNTKVYAQSDLPQGPGMRIFPLFNPYYYRPPSNQKFLLVAVCTAGPAAGKPLSMTRITVHTGGGWSQGDDGETPTGPVDVRVNVIPGKRP